MAYDAIESTGGDMAAKSSSAGANAAASGMTAGTAFGALSLVSTLFGAYAHHQAGQAQKRNLERNAQIARYQAEDAIKRGDVAAERRLTQSQQVMGAQRAALASQGVDVNSGSAAEAQASTAYLGELDAVTIRNNAAREAWGYQVQAGDYQMRGRYAAQTEDQQAVSTLLTGSSNLLLAKAGFGRGPMSNDPLFTRS